MNWRYRYRDEDSDARDERARDEGRRARQGNGNGDGTTGWRWTIGILLTIQMAMIGYLAVRIDKIDQQVSANTATRALLDERTATYVPIITKNRELINEHAREIYQLESRIEILEDNCPTCKRVGRRR